MPSDAARRNRREQLLATLEALIYNDDVDLADTFQPVGPSSHAKARNTANQQPHTPFQACSPGARINNRADYRHGPAVESATRDAPEYYQTSTCSDAFHPGHAHSNGVGGTDKDTLWFPCAPAGGLERMAFDSGANAIASSCMGPPTPTPTPTPSPGFHHGHHNNSGSTASHYGHSHMNTTPDHGPSAFAYYDFCGQLATPSHVPTSQSTEIAYAHSNSQLKSPDNPVVHFMSRDMFTYDGSHSPSESNDMNNNQSAATSGDELGLQASTSPRVEQQDTQPGRAQAPSSETTTSERPAKRLRRHSRSSGSTWASPSPSPVAPPSACSRPPSQPPPAPAAVEQPRSQAPKQHRAHSATEKRYRAGINDKFEALRSCLESRKRNGILGRERPEDISKGKEETGAERVAGGCGGGATLTPVNANITKGSAGGAGGAGGAEAVPKMNKAEVLSEATEYIQQLEDEKALMLEELKMLAQCLRAARMALQPPRAAMKLTMPRNASNEVEHHRII